MLNNVTLSNHNKVIVQVTGYPQEHWNCKGVYYLRCNKSICVLFRNIAVFASQIIRLIIKLNASMHITIIIVI